MANQIYEYYWKLTNAYTDYNATKFRTALEICVDFIDESAGSEYSGEKYSDLQSRLNDQFHMNDISIRKAINQLIKMGFIEPFLRSYHPLSKDYISASSNKKRETLLSKIVYSNSSLNRAVTDESSLKEINFLIKTLIEHGKLSLNQICGLMTVNLNEIEAEFLDAESLEYYEQHALQIDFYARKYNQVSHFCNLLSKLDDLAYIDNNLYFKDDAIQIFGEDLTLTVKKRDPYLHGIYKKELKSESIEILGKSACMIENVSYPVLIASHIKPFIKSDDIEAYDVNNGFLLSKNFDSLFDLGYITFSDAGEIICSKHLPEDVISNVDNYSLNPIFLNNKRKVFLNYHRENVFEKKFNSQP